MAIEVNIRFYDELNDFIFKHLRKRTTKHRVHTHTTVKDLIESFGVPHTEVDLILVDGQSVDFNFRPLPDAMISVYPVFESLDISGLTNLRPKPLRINRFILDVHLGKLARLLRLYGFDSLYRNDYTDPDLISIAQNEKRIILTRDIGILKQRHVTHGYFIRSQEPQIQIKEVIRRFGLTSSICPFNLCMKCNGNIQPVEKKEIGHLLLPRTRKFSDDFFRCNKCRMIYWKGSHYKKMVEMPAQGDQVVTPIHTIS